MCTPTDREDPVLRPATDDDRDRALTWRNHPQVRDLSFGSHEIQPDEHAAWWSRVEEDPGTALYVYERRGTPAGIVRLEHEDDATAGWSFYLDVEGLESTGELLLAWIEIERDVLRLVFDELGLQRIHGEVLASNEAVLAMHARHGFVASDPYEKVVDGETFEVVHVEVTSDTVRLPGRSR